MTDEKSLQPPSYGWDERYRHQDTPWDRGEPSPFLNVCLERLEPGQTILVPGCGAGHEVVALATLGFRVSAIDFSEVAINRCQQALDERGAKADLYLADVLTWSVEQPFDAVYEQTCLCALDPSDRGSYASQLARWLRPEGHLFAAFLQTESTTGPPFHCPIPEMEQLFSHPEWDWPEQPGVRVERGPRPFELAYILTRR